VSNKPAAAAQGKVVRPTNPRHFFDLQQEFIHMKPTWQSIAAAAATALGLVGVADAATIGNLSGQSCGAGTGTWHFINNQSGTTSVGTLSATWSSGNTCTVNSSKITPNGTHHFYCTASGTLLAASTNLNGKLVLSHFTCEDIKEPPPPCDPKKEVCEPPPK
jgi:hypothetical protein